MSNQCQKHLLIVPRCVPTNGSVQRDGVPLLVLFLDPFHVELCTGGDDPGESSFVSPQLLDA